MERVHPLSLAQVISGHLAAKFREEFSGEWAAALLWRPPALALAWALQRTRVTPTAVTCAALLSLPLMASAAVLLPPATALPWIVALAILFMVLDCADGTLARITGRTSSLGQYADFASDICYRIAFYGSAGWVLSRHPALAGHWLAEGGFGLALVSAWLMTFARLCRVYIELRFAQPAAGAPAAPASGFDILAAFVSGLDGLAPLVAAAAWFMAWPQAFFAWIFVYALLDVGQTQWTALGALRRRS